MGNLTMKKYIILICFFFNFQTKTQTTQSHIQQTHITAAAGGFIAGTLIGTGLDYYYGKNSDKKGIARFLTIVAKNAACAGLPLAAVCAGVSLMRNSITNNIQDQSFIKRSTQKVTQFLLKQLSDVHVKQNKDGTVTLKGSKEQIEAIITKYAIPGATFVAKQGWILSKAGIEALAIAMQENPPVIIKNNKDQK